MSEMTLERVRDILRNAGRFDIYGTNEQACDLADAIDAHLTRAPVQVTDGVARDVAECLQFSGWATGGDFEDDFLPDVRRAIEYARLAQPVVACKVCDPNGLFDTDGNGPYDCYACGKKAQPHPQAAQGGEAVAEIDELDCETGPGTPCITMLGPMPPLGTKLYTHPAERAAVPEGWQSIDTAPTDGTPHVRGLRVFSSQDGAFLYWDAYVGRIDTEDGNFVDLGGDQIGWEAMDFTHWHPLSAAPTLAGKEG